MCIIVIHWGGEKEYFMIPPHFHRDLKLFVTTDTSCLTRRHFLELIHFVKLQQRPSKRLIPSHVTHVQVQRNLSSLVKMLNLKCVCKRMLSDLELT